MNAVMKGSPGQGWRVRGVSVQGYSHLRDGVECQDAYRYRVDERTGAIVLAVADGAGSRARSAEGAALAVGLAIERFSHALGARGVPGTSETWHERLREEYEGLVAFFRDAIARLGPEPKQFAATLTVAVVAPPWLGIVRLGDGFVVGRARDHTDADQLHVLSFPKAASEYVNETVFLTSASALSDVTIECVFDEALTGVLVASDGLIPPGIDQANGSALPNGSFLDPILTTVSTPRSDPTEVARLLLDDRISSLSGDDKTLLVAVRT